MGGRGDRVGKTSEGAGWGGGNREVVLDLQVCNGDS